MEVAVHQNQEFQFNSTATSPYGSPRRFGNPFDLHFHYTSAPSSPARAAAIYAHFNSAAAMAAAATTAATASPAPALPPPIPTPRPSSVIPFEWEEKPGTPKCASRASTVDSSDAFDFVFDFSRQLNKEGPLPVADDLFFEDHPSAAAAARGPRPLKPPPRLHRPISSSSPDHALLDGGARSAAGAVSSPRSPRTLKGLWSPRGRGGVGEEFDPFTAAMVEATRDRGRDRSSSSAAVAASPSFSSPSRLRNKGSSRSLSPRPLDRSGGEVVLGTGLILPPAAAPAASAASGTASKGGGGGGGRRWRLRDLLLFRSASEGRVTGSRRSKDPMRKFSFLTSSHSSSSLLSPFCSKKLLGGVNEEEWRRDLSFRSIDSSSGDQAAAVSSSADVDADADAAGGAGRAASKEGKKKNGGLPPYGQGIFSCIRFNPTICSIARGVGSASFARR